MKKMFENKISSDFKLNNIIRHLFIYTIVIEALNQMKWSLEMTNTKYFEMFNIVHINSYLLFR